MDIEWEDGKAEEIDFPEHLTQYVDDYLTELEEERQKEEEWEQELKARAKLNLN